MTPRVEGYLEEDNGRDAGLTFDRRSGNNMGIYGLMLAALINVITVVWFAASLNAAVSGLIESNNRRDIVDAKRDVVQTALSQQVAEIANQLAVVSDRVLRNTNRLDKAR